MQIIRLGFCLTIVALCCSGCETMHGATKEVGATVGKGMTAMGGVAEGAAQSDTTSNNQNPYGR